MKHLYTFNFNLRLLRTFALVFGVVFIFFVIFLESVLWRLDETVHYPTVIERQVKTSELYSPKYFNVDNDYKKFFLRKHPAKIVAVGTSRVFQIDREDIGSEKFFNAGSSASTSKDIDGMIDIVQSIPDENLPDTLLVGIDPWLFNPRYPGNKKGAKAKLSRIPVVYGAYGIFKAAKNRMAAYSLLINEERNILPSLISVTEGIGLNAKLFNAGFGVDGSYHYPPDREEEIPKSHEDWKDVLSKDRYRFAPASALSQEALSKFENLLKYCQANGINVIGYLMPFRPDFYEALTTTDSHAAYFKEFRKQIPKLIRSYGFKCHDYSSPAGLGLRAEDFRDKMHVKSYVYRDLMYDLRSSLAASTP